MRRAPTELESRLERRLASWRRLVATYRLAQQDCEPSEEEWQLNKENADMLERLSAEIREDMAAARLISRSQYQPKLFEQVNFALRNARADARGRYARGAGTPSSAPPAARCKITTPSAAKNAASRWCS